MGSISRGRLGACVGAIAIASAALGLGCLDSQNTDVGGLDAAIDVSADGLAIQVADGEVPGRDAGSDAPIDARDASDAAPSTLTVGGHVTGLAGKGLVVQNGGGDDLTIAADGAFTFVTAIAQGATYDVTIATQPTDPAQTCVVDHGAGTATTDVTDVAITCTTNTYAIGGNVTGLASASDAGTGLVLANGADTLPIDANGAFAFPTKVASGEPYAVTVKSNPTSPAQTCSVSGATGTVVADDVTSVVVNCNTKTFTLGGTVTGLAGKGLVLADGASTATIGANGTFAFPTPIASGTPYAVTVKTQPTTPSQTCVVSNPSGTIGNANVTSLKVACTTDTFTVGGSITGLAGSGLVLTDNGGDAITIPAGATSFTFPTAIASGAAYDVEIRTQPSNVTQVCTLAANKGAVGAAKVTSVAVSCATSTFTISGTISGLAGSGLTLGDGANAIPVSGTSFTFPAVPSGTKYVVAAAAQPTGPWQTCVAAAGGSGTVTNANVTGVAVRCTTNSYPVVVNVSGLTGNRAQISDSVESLAPVNGANTFPTQIASGGSYAIGIAPQPVVPWQTCTVTSGNASGTVQGSAVSVDVACTTNAYAISFTINGGAPQCAAGTVSDGTHSTSVQPPGYQQPAVVYTLPTLPSGSSYAASFAFPNDSLCVCSYAAGAPSANSATISSGTIGGSDLSFTITCSELIP